jgi:hypothetical protein
VIFLSLTVREAADFTRSVALVGIVGVSVLLFQAVYVLRAFKVVYRERWRSILPKSAGVGIVYGIACLLALMITIGVASLG